MARKSIELHESFRPCRDYIIAMMGLTLMASLFYGLRVIILVALSLVAALVCDLLASLLRKEPYVASDISSCMFAMVFTMLLPASSRYEIVLVGTVVTILIGKHAFGGYGAYPFNPAAFGFAFTSICWPSDLYLYPQSSSRIGLGFDSGATLQTAVASALKYGGIPTIDTADLMIGNYPGPMGTTFCLIILSSLVLLIAHGAMTWHIPVAYLLTCSAWAVLFPRIPVGLLYSLIYELFSGAIIFAAVFIVAEPTTSPANPTAKILYGLLLGIGTMVFRTWGAFEMGVCFTVLLLNPLSSYLDRHMSRQARRRQAKAKSRQRGE